MPGRREDKIWNGFNKKKADGKQYFVGECKGCNEVVAGLTDRLKQHASECSKLQELNIWGDAPAAKRPKVQKQLIFGATTIKNQKQGSPFTQEQEEDMLKCKVCEKMMEEVHLKMATTPGGAEIKGHRLDKNNKQVIKEQARIAARAIEILEDVCKSPKFDEFGTMGRTVCEDALQESDEELEQYVKANVESKAFATKVCRKKCAMKSELSDMIERMKASMPPTPVAKNLTFWDELQEAAAIVQGQWKLVVLASTCLTVLVAALRIAYDVRQERRQKKAD
eukprot:EG_transcript_21679